jgi:YspA, cpYpsA-related SLOG family
VRRVLISGSRDWPWSTVVWEALSQQLEKSPDKRFILVHGACPNGVDAHASEWAKQHQDDVVEERHPAEWQRYGRRAGFLRNEVMVQCGADLVLAFRLNGSAGTTSTINLARAAKIPSVVMDAYA